MRPPKGLIQGAKFSGRHTTVIPLSVRAIKVLKPIRSVRKIIIGPIEVYSSRSGDRITIRKDLKSTSIKVACRMSKATHILWVVGDIDDIHEAINTLRRVRVTRYK